MILEDFIPPKITLTEESLAIKSTMYEVSIDYEDIEKVEIVVDEGHQIQEVQSKVGQRPITTVVANFMWVHTRSLS